MRFIIGVISLFLTIQQASAIGDFGTMLLIRANQATHHYVENVEEDRLLRQTKAISDTAKEGGDMEAPLRIHLDEKIKTGWGMDDAKIYTRLKADRTRDYVSNIVALSSSVEETNIQSLK
jgi:hypothetical protein|mmetsp:Transcript_3023/g.5493  ORF Transcript_3023/g.5493 Transcript_3023/m.5493 type:complete len:120 (-) Transcript_3023:350-709(-)|eukprot:CAMPEP_0198279934 /NCGR_PEP_ID=MMETSP1449-20131203/136_1 /TAXON_ID=420275 /ORGANISM="Attheya septentrionalis, Strain CCMP2084" /LENGTH=119 /DNA_ID=CAMNT_0043975185 /DNA_START=156 /DNA_END=515 /DNA_ORIENTATION=+